MIIFVNVGAVLFVLSFQKLPRRFGLPSSPRMTVVLMIVVLMLMLKVGTIML